MLLCYYYYCCCYYHYYCCFKGNIRETPERRGGAHVALPERIDTILNRTELNLTDFNRETPSTRYSRENVVGWVLRLRWHTSLDVC